jgi:RHS repeat-associated protein
LQRNSNVNLVANQTSSYDANDRLNSDVFDNNGSTKVSNGKSYNYDFENHLTSTSDGITVIYDGDGNRVSKTVGGITTKYLVDTNNLTGYAQVVEELQNNLVVKAYTYGLDLISQRQSSGVSFYNYDGHGSVRGLSNNIGSLTDTYSYDAFGTLIEQTGNTSNSYLYAGEQFDSDLGFYYNRARYLNASTGRFISQDSYEGNSSDPRSLHKYTYGSNDGVNNIDPSGNFSLPQAIAVVTVITVLAAISYGVYSNYVFKNTPRVLSFDWRNTWSYEGDNMFSESEVATIKYIAQETVKEAFLGFRVIISEGGGTNKAIVTPQLDNCGQTAFVGSNNSKLSYPTIRNAALRYAQQRGLTSRSSIVEALGRGIGATAAHEFNHQFGYGGESNNPQTYDYFSCDTPEHFFDKLHWSDNALQSIKKNVPTVD